MNDLRANSFWVLCTKCRQPLPASSWQNAGIGSCPSCGARLEAFVFPALFRAIGPGAVGERILAEGESACFYHADRRAVTPCDGCGRFLCALCDVEFNGRHLCPPCLESGRKKGRQHDLETRRTRYDYLALMLTGLPYVCMWPLWIVTAPVGIYVACRYWNAPPGLVARGAKVRFAVAIALGLIGLVAWVLWAYYVYRSEMRS